MYTARFVALSVALGALLIAGCKGYQSYPKSEAAAQLVHEAIAARSLDLESDESLSESEEAEHRRYLSKVIMALQALEAERIMLHTNWITPGEARQLDMAIAGLFRILETMAVFPGRLDAEGEPADTATAEMLEETELPEVPAE